MVDVTAVIAIFGFIGVIGTTAGLIFWLDRKIATELRGIRAEMHEMRAEIRAEMHEMHAETRGEMHEMRAETRGEMHEMRTEMRGEMHEMRTEMRGEIRRLDRDIRVLSAKVDRAQGNLDVLVFGERGVPPPVEAERAEMENLAEEAVGN